MNEILKERFFKLEQELELADAEIAKLKAENARLAAALWRYGRHDNECESSSVEECICGLDIELITARQALHDLLAPTIELLTKIENWRQGRANPTTQTPHPADSELIAELQRLRALGGERKEK